MPHSVAMAILLVGLLDIALIYSATRSPGLANFAIAIAVLLWAGLLRGHSAAWQYARSAPPVLLGMTLVAELLLRDRIGSIVGLIVCLIATAIIFSPLFAIRALLGRGAARIFYGLACPRCTSLEVKAKNLLFTRKECGGCSNVWTESRDC